MASPQQAASAASFTKTLGINIHFSHAGTPYTNVSQVEAALAYLNPNGIGTGLSMVRDQDLWTPSADFVALGALGYKLDIFAGYNAPGNNNAATFINYVRSLVSAGYVGLLEGPLEVDNNGWGLANFSTYTALNGTTYSGWKAAIAWQSDLYNTFHGSTQIALFSLANPSDAAANSPAVQAAQQLGTSLGAITNQGNVHYYTPNGYSPGDSRGDSLVNVIAQETAYTPGKPFTVTEAGFTTIPGEGYQGNPYVNGVYTLDLVLDAFKAGATLTDLYELFDESAIYPGSDQGGFGLFDANGNAKAPATDLRNLLSVIGDNGATATTFTPGSLAYSVSGLASPGQSVLLQKSNGNFELVVWSDASIYVNGKLTTAPTQNVTVNLGATYGTVKVYDPTQSATAIQTLSNVSSVSLAITDHPLIVEVAPAAPSSGTITVTTGQTVTVPNGTYTVNMAGTSETVTSGSTGPDTYVFNNTAMAVATINGFKVGTDHITVPKGYQSFTQTAGGIVITINDGTVATLAGVQGATALQVFSSAVNTTMVQNGQTITTQAGFTDTVNISGSASVITNGNDTVNCGTGTDTIKVNAGNVVVNGSTGSIAFTDTASGTATLKLAGGTTTATLGSGGGSVYVAGNVTLTGGSGADTYIFTRGVGASTAVINNFVVGTDHLHLSGFTPGKTVVTSITANASGVNVALTDGTAITLKGVATTIQSQLFS